MKARHVDHHALVRAFSDFLDFVVSGYIEFDAASIDLRDNGVCSYTMTSRCGCEVTDIDRGSDCAFARIEVASHRIKGGVLHSRDHHRCGEYRRQRGIFELIGKMGWRHAQCKGSFRSDRNGTHVSFRYGAHG